MASINQYVYAFIGTATSSSLPVSRTVHLPENKSLSPSVRKIISVSLFLERKKNCKVTQSNYHSRREGRINNYIH